MTATVALSAKDKETRERLLLPPTKAAQKFFTILSEELAQAGAANVYSYTTGGKVATEADVKSALVAIKGNNAALKRVSVLVSTVIEEISAAQAGALAARMDEAAKADLQRLLTTSDKKWSDLAALVSAEVNADFPAKTSKKILDAILKLSSEYETLAKEGYPFLVIGPTGCGKTAAFEELARSMNWAYFEFVGGEGKSPGDVYGLQFPDGKAIPGPASNAFAFARDEYKKGTGKKAILLLDELTRNNIKTLGSLLELTRKRRASYADAYGVQYTCDFMWGGSPLWGDEHAPMDNLLIAGACNPWGAKIDDALNRRFVHKRFVSFDRDVISEFSPPHKELIESNWKQVEASGSGLMLPIEYDLVGQAAAPDDTRIFSMFADSLRFKELGSKVMLTSFLAEAKKFGVKVPRYS